MTFSILVSDSATGVIGGAAATGSLCVGAWVLRGDPRIGMSASQGASPSTLWGEEVLRRMSSGADVGAAVEAVTLADVGRGHRQLTSLDLRGNGAAFTGEMNSPAMGSRVFEGGVAAGNLLQSEDVLDALVAAWQSDRAASPAVRLLRSLRAAQRAGGDRRGLFSAALLLLSRDCPPLSLRIDYDEDPLEALQALYKRSTSGEYHDWFQQVPTLDDPHRILDCEFPDQG